MQSCLQNIEHIKKLILLIFMEILNIESKILQSNVPQRINKIVNLCLHGS